ncbi:ferric iron reductase protein FhuF [Agrobacterium vitis]|nr:ferric iron reductase protein FhuF [Agrobacterium vitis]
MTCIAETTQSPHAVNSTDGLTDLGDLIARDTGNRYPYAGRRFFFSQPEGVHRIACADLLDRQRLDAVIERFASTYPPETDRRALVSFWSLFYFSALMIDPIICWLELRRILPLAINEIDLLIDSTTGLPSGFLLTNIGTVEPQATIHEAMSGVVRGHLEPLIAVMAKQAGLSKRLLWTNAAAYLTWMIDEIGHQGAEALKTEGMVLLEASNWPDDWKNPFHTMVRVGRTDSGEYIGHRRICCLRYAVPGVGGCGGSCPVAEGQIAARQG